MNKELERPRKIRPASHPISVIRALDNCRWCYKYTKWPDSLRKNFFAKCKAELDESDEDLRAKWAALFDVLAKYDRKSLRKMCYGSTPALAACFNWASYKAYQRGKIAARRARAKAV